MSSPRHVGIVGAGIVGLSTAWFLQRQGVQVTILDRSHPGAGASWGSAGWLTPELTMFDRYFGAYYPRLGRVSPDASPNGTPPDSPRATRGLNRHDSTRAVISEEMTAREAVQGLTGHAAGELQVSGRVASRCRSTD